MMYLQSSTRWSIACEGEGSSQRVGQPPEASDKMTHATESNGHRTPREDVRSQASSVDMEHSGVQRGRVLEPRGLAPFTNSVTVSLFRVEL